MSTIDFPPPAKHLHFTQGGNLAVRSLPGLHPGAAHISGWLYHHGLQVPVAEIYASQIHLPWIPPDEPEAPTLTEATDPAVTAIVAEAVITAWVDAQASTHYRAAERCYRAYDQRTALRAHQGLQDDPATEATLRHLTALIMLGCEFIDLPLTHAVALLDGGHAPHEAADLTRATFPNRPYPPTHARQRWAL